MDFKARLKQAWQTADSMVCVGLDPQLDRLPASIRRQPQPMLAFNKCIIEATAAHACSYKPQFAYYAAENRLDELRQTIAFIRSHAPHCLIILDAKRGDIGSTAEQYAREAFDVYDADAVTINPYMGGDTLLPFTRLREKGVIVLCKTSNPGSSELQDLQLENGHPLYMEVARRAASDWNTNDNIALVVGATYPRDLANIRGAIGDMPLLVPGIGAQGGDLRATLEAGLAEDGWGLMINSSRGIIHASSGEDFAQAAEAAAVALKESCNAIRASIMGKTEK